VAASCDNKFIPDNGLKIFMHPSANPTQDITNINQAILVKDFGKNPGADAFQGFQNCPK
jgi:hypothetical protein